MLDYWKALGSRQKLGLAAGAGTIIVATAAFGLWALRDPLVPLASGLLPERQAAVVHELEQGKIPYRIGDDGSTLLVASSDAGKARAALNGRDLGIPPNAGLEIFKDTDFSTTDFAQRINYERALQGEITRTLQTMDGVRSARVHVILPEGGLLKRSDAKASVAVTLQMLPGSVLLPAQIVGLKRMVAASVPEARPENVVVLDQAGKLLGRGAGNPLDVESGAQLDLKRQVDTYLEGKLAALLANLAPNGRVSLSADATLDIAQMKVTTDVPVAAPGATADHPTGVIVKERQSQRGAATGAEGATAHAADVDDSEYEYAVGHRMEQSLSNPGAIKRLSVAVVIRGAPGSLTVPIVERLVAHAIGIDSARGDSVDVALLPPIDEPRVTPSTQALATRTQTAEPPAPTRASAFAASFAASSARANSGVSWSAVNPSRHAPLPLALAFVLVTLGVWARRSSRRRAMQRRVEPIDVDATAAKLRAWLHPEQVQR